MSMHFRSLSDRVTADGVISPEELLELRRGAWSDGRIEPAEAEAIFAINDRLSVRSAEWTDFFVEALGEHIVNGAEPRGYVNDAQATWLIAHLDKDGRVESCAELELLAKVFEKAESVPQALRDYALAQIERAVLSSDGPTRDGGGLDARRINEAETRLLRRFVFAAGGDRPAGVSRAEAELLYRIKDATLGADNAPDWRLLFVQGVGNYLMGFSGHEQLSRARAAELEAFMNDATPKIGRFFGSLAKTGADDVIGLFGRKGSARGHEEQVAAAEAVTGEERDWLEAQIESNGEIDELDRALLQFLAE